MSRLWMFTLLFICLTTSLYCQESMYLRHNLNRAEPGDYIVTVQNKNYTILHIYDRTPTTLTIEEVTVPAQRMHGRFISWKQWMNDNAPGNTAWIMYRLDLNTGNMLGYFSLTKNAWFDMSKANNFLSTLLNLRLEKVPSSKRRRIGLPSIIGEDRRSFWQPRLVVDGQEIEDVAFNAWQTEWPKDGTELAGKSIEVYLPVNNDLYPAYFPYWLQISGMVGSAKVRIVDSGTNMHSPAPPLGMRNPSSLK